MFSLFFDYFEMFQDSRKIRVIEVRRNEERHQHVSPHIGAVVTAKVINIGPRYFFTEFNIFFSFFRYAKCQLLSVEDTILGGDYTALLRKEDIRSTERDKVRIIFLYRASPTLFSHLDWNLPKPDSFCRQMNNLCFFADRNLRMRSAGRRSAGPSDFLRRHSYFLPHLHGWRAVGSGQFAQFFSIYFENYPNSSPHSLRL